MDVKINFFKSFIYYSLGTLGPRLISLLLFPLLTFYISTEELGLYDFFVVLISLTLPVFSLQISFSTYRWLIDCSSKNEEKESIIINSVLVTLISSAFFSAITYFLTWYLEVFEILEKYIIDFILIMFIVSFFNVFQQISRGTGDLKKYTLSGVLNTVSIFIFSFIFIFIFDDRVRGLLFAYFLGGVVSTGYLFVCLRCWRELDLKKINKTLLKKQILYSLPFVPNSMGLIAVNFFNRYLIATFFTIALTGIFALASKLAMIVYVINSIFILVMQDNLIKNNIVNRDYNVLRKFVNFQLGLSMLVLPVSPFIFKFISSDAYYEAWKYFPVLCLFNSYNAIASYMSIDYQTTGKTGSLMITTLISAFVGCLLSWFLIKYGIYGLLFGTLLGGIFYVFIVDKSLSYGGIEYFNIVTFLLIFLIELFFIIKYNEVILMVIVFAINLILFFMLNKRLIIEFLMLIKAKVNKNEL